MIPKKIHYCWFGKDPFPEHIKQWMQSWKVFCADYEIIEWNADNFNFSTNEYARQAYEAKKWAFASDYARLFVLYHYGGIYLDCDIELFKSLDLFLIDKAFAGFEHSGMVGASIMGAEQGHAFIKTLLDSYNNRTFIKENGTFDYTTIPELITTHCLACGLTPNKGHQKQVLADFTIYPSNYFYRKYWEDSKLIITDETYAFHHFEGFWLPLHRKVWRTFLRKIKKYLPFLVYIYKKMRVNHV